jgi:hypothetical protein
VTLLTVFLVTKPLKPVIMTSSPLLPNTLRILVLVEACNKSSKLSCRVLLPEPVLMGAQRGFVIKGESARDHSGYSVSNAGDVNGDGLDDLIIGAYGADPSGKLNHHH